MLGMMWNYREKQQKKVALLRSLEKAADSDTEASVHSEEFEESAQPRNESVEMSGVSTLSKPKTVC